MYQYRVAQALASLVCKLKKAHLREEGELGLAPELNGVQVSLCCYHQKFQGSPAD
jgi:hypothetical protein